LFHTFSIHFLYMFHHVPSFSFIFHTFSIHVPSCSIMFHHFHSFTIHFLSMFHHFPSFSIIFPYIFPTCSIWMYHLFQAWWACPSPAPSP
jgi:hypothetical protein